MTLENMCISYNISILEGQKIVNITIDLKYISKSIVEIVEK